MNTKQSLIILLSILLFLIIVFLTITGKMFTILSKTSLSPYGIFVQSPIPSAFKSNECDPMLWSHVYFPNRLYRIEPCIAVTGTITGFDNLPDGDAHVYIQLDTPYNQLINSFNELIFSKNMLGEVICQGIIQKESDADDACKGYVNTIRIPQQGTPVRVIGTYVIDIPYGWAEIHPISRIEKL